MTEKKIPKTLSDLRFHDSIPEAKRHVIRLATDASGNKYAVKQGEGNSLVNEFNMMRKIDCPYVMKAINLIQENGVNYLVMDQAEQDLFIVLCNEGPKSEPEVKEIMFSITSAVNILHTNHIWHRDVKPENVFIFREQIGKRYVLADLEYSREFQTEWISKEYIGTDDYMAPELLLKQKYNNKVDCWALGVTMYLMLTQHYPFDTQLDQCMGVIREDESISPIAFDLIRKLLTVNIGQRYSAQQALEHPFFRGEEPVNVSELSTDIVREVESSDVLRRSEIVDPNEKQS